MVSFYINLLFPLYIQAFFLRNSIDGASQEIVVRLIVLQGIDRFHTCGVAVRERIIMPAVGSVDDFVYPLA